MGEGWPDEDSITEGHLALQARGRARPVAGYGDPFSEALHHLVLQFGPPDAYQLPARRIRMP
jgi:hypothetical protein